MLPPRTYPLSTMLGPDKTPGPPYPLSTMLPPRTIPNPWYPPTPSVPCFLTLSTMLSPRTIPNPAQYHTSSDRPNPPSPFSTSPDPQYRSSLYPPTPLSTDLSGNQHTRPLSTAL
eukprot:3109657-Rhodomonas_salina.8